MSDVLVVWDSRFENERLEQFIQELTGELTRYSMSFRIVSLSNRHAPSEGLIKPSMRALLDLLHEEAPYHLITFGMQANALGTLLNPALKCELLTNRLPDWLEGEKKGSPIVKLSNWLNRDSSWGDGIEVDNFYFAPFLADASAEVVYFSEDHHASLIRDQLQAERIAGRAISTDAFMRADKDEIERGGLFVVSSDMVESGRVVEYANAYGIPVLLISSKKGYFGIREGENGWLVESPQQTQYYSYLHNWCGMSQDARNMISYYSRMVQSQQSGLRCYCASLGYPRRLEFQEFKIRG